MINRLHNSLQSALTRLNPTAQVAKASVSLPAASVASTKVIFGSQSSEIAEIYSLSPQKRVTTPTAMDSTHIQSLMRSALSSEASTSFSGLGGELLKQLKDNPGDLSQVLTAAQVGDSAVNSLQESAVTLTITTQSGSSVNITLTQQSDGIAVEVKTTGNTLNQDEAEAVSQLGNAFQKALDGLAKQPPQLDIEGLTKFDSSVLKSVDLKTDIRRGDTEIQSLNFHADGAERWVGYQDQDFSLKMTSDRNQLALSGDALQKQLALSAYEKQFDKARSDGNGDKAQMNVLKSVFRALNSTDAAQENDAAGPVNTAIRLGSDSKARLSGLADFSLSLTQKEESVNPFRPNEKQSFSYQASQTTEDNRQPADGSGNIKQTSHAHLSASWYKPIDASTPLSLSMLKSSQNYYYHEVEQDSVNVTTLNFNNQGKLASVGYLSQVDNRETVKKYLLGELVENITTPEKYTRENLIKTLRE